MTPKKIAAVFLNNAEVVEASTFLGYDPVDPELTALYERERLRSQDHDERSRYGNRHEYRKAKALERRG